jgi:hypothetical protein
VKRYSFNIKLKGQTQFTFHTIVENKKEAAEHLFNRFPPDKYIYQDFYLKQIISGTYEELSFITDDLIKEAHLTNIAYPYRVLI